MILIVSIRFRGHRRATGIYFLRTNPGVSLPLQHSHPIQGYPSAWEMVPLSDIRASNATMVEQGPDGATAHRGC
ncbi:MAG TPA: hypothetical protein VK620_30700 [Bradyrhizobium sp.]|jgi:hypothetical protein|nr:hypothetical protein [Bradyrhizobium sp.]